MRHQTLPHGFHLIGYQNVPDFCAGVDNRVILGSVAVGAVYAFLIWGIPALGF
jgi:hypothetical protein